MRDVIVAANWKMHTTPADAGELAATIAARTQGAGVTRVICPPFVALSRGPRRAGRRRPDGRGRRPDRPSRAGRRVHRRDRRPDAHRPRHLGHRRPLRAPARCRRDRCAHRAQARAGHRCRAAADPVRRGAARGARGGPGDATSSTRRSGAPSPRSTRTSPPMPGWSSPTSRCGPSARAGRRPAPTPRPWPTPSGPASARSAGRTPRPTCRSCTAGSVTSANIGEFLTEPAIDGALVGGASLKPDEMAGIVARAGITAEARGLVAGARRRWTERVTGARPRPIVLVVLDGFGIGHDPAGDAIAAAPMPTWRGLLARWPHSVLRASEDAVGLPAGQMGNSEVGHLNLGAGRPGPAGPAAHRRGHRRRLVHRAAGPAGGVCPGRRPPAACSTSSASSDRAGCTPTTGTWWPWPSWPSPMACPRVAIHALLDGRDTPPASALGFVADLEPRLAAVHPGAAIASVGGRYFAMDRDQRWERIEAGYDAIVHAEAAHRAPSATAAIEAAYARGETDEFVVPTVIDGPAGPSPAGRRRGHRACQLPGRSGPPAGPCPGRRGRLRRLRPDARRRVAPRPTACWS